MARRQAGAVALAVLAAVLIGASLPSAVSAKKPHVLLNTLPTVLNVTSAPSESGVLHPGSTVNVAWKPIPGVQVPAGAATVKVELCYAKVSQKDRGWRKENDDLFKDKACQFKVTEKPYGSGSDSFEYHVGREIPSAFYFVRAYVLNGEGTYVAYGQATANSTDGDLKHFLQVESITGVTASIKVAASIFSAFSVVSLAFFFVVEKRKKDQ